MKREEFRLILPLLKRQPWLENKEEILEGLLFGECSTPEQRSLLLELIDRFLHIGRAQYLDLIKALVKKLVNDQELEDYSTQVVAMAADSNPDSSQHLLYHLKPLLQEAGWMEHKAVNQFGRSYQVYKKSPAHKNIVLIDEFIGSGQTAINRAKTLQEIYLGAGVEGFTVRIMAITCTEVGFQAIEDAGYKVEAINLLKRGISDYYPTSEVAEKVALMLELEQPLSKVYKGRDMPSLGYGKVESLYTREDGNTPNSVFPIFWWPFLNGEKRRLTLLVRAMGDA